MKNVGLTPWGFLHVPDYEAERKSWANGHYGGAYLFQDSLAIEVVPLAEGATEWGAK